MGWISRMDGWTEGMHNVEMQLCVWRCTGVTDVWRCRGVTEMCDRGVTDGKKYPSDIPDTCPTAIHPIITHRLVPTHSGAPPSSSIMPHPGGTQFPTQAGLPTQTCLPGLDGRHSHDTQLSNPSQYLHALTLWSLYTVYKYFNALAH